ncbi:MAG TPA: hypothetical protein VLG48_06665 [Candidatus Methylomirabilis sp.]|nr:hypothetical protein [Candidatus Methylomirabilis sp.]
MRLARGTSREVPKQEAFAVETLLRPPERRGLTTKAAVLEEIKRLTDKTGKARLKHHERQD